MRRNGNGEVRAQIAGPGFFAISKVISLNSVCPVRAARRMIDPRGTSWRNRVRTVRWLLHLVAEMEPVMIPALQNLEPQALWKHFAALAAIPRASTKEAAARNYVLAHASRLGLKSVQDDAGNVVVHKPARPGREQAPMALLQGHLDMVCEKNEGTLHDFDVDPIKVTRDGDWLKADGTTLGSDNGVGVAAALAVMESGDIAPGPLEFVFT